MRHQQVNLLAPMLRKPHALLSARLALRLCLTAMALLGLVYLFAWWSAARLAGEQQRLQSRRDDITAQLQQLAAQQHANDRSQNLAAERTQLLADRDRKAALLTALARHQLANTRGFSPQFVGFSRQRVDGLWLTRIELSGSGRDIALYGSTLAEELIPRYLHELGQEPVFAGTRFQHAVLQDAGAAAMTFELRTGAAATP